MENLKFRVFDENINDFYYSNQFDYCSHGEDRQAVFNCDDKGNLIVTVHTQERPVGSTKKYVLNDIEQFIGISDDNKQEIYKNDIILLDSDDGFYLCQVVFGEIEDWLTGFYLKKLKELEINLYPDYGKDLEFFKTYNPEKKSFIVIGNIHENSELLENIEE